MYKLSSTSGTFYLTTQTLGYPVLIQLEIRYSYQGLKFYILGLFVYDVYHSE